MKIFHHVLLLILLSAPLSAMAEERYQHTLELARQPEWLTCSTDNQCVTATGRTCEYRFAVNKKYLDEAVAAVINDCSKPYRLVPGTKVKCVNNECVLAIPDKQ